MTCICSVLSLKKQICRIAAEMMGCRSYFDHQKTALNISPELVMVCDNAETAMRTCSNCNLVMLSPYITLLSDYASMQRLSHYHLLGDSFLPPVTAVCLRGQQPAPYVETLISLFSNRYRAMTAYRP